MGAVCPFDSGSPPWRLVEMLACDQQAPSTRPLRLQWLLHDASFQVARGARSGLS